MLTQKILDRVRENFSAVLKQEAPLGLEIWHEFIKMHPADIATFLSDLEPDQAKELFVCLPQQLKLPVLEDLSYSLKIICLSAVDHNDRAYLLGDMSMDTLTDFFDELSDEELKEYLKLLTKKDREWVLSLMQFNPESAGGIMDAEVLSLMQDFTVEKSVQILQRLQPSRDLHRQIFVTDHRHHLVGYIFLEDLVLQQPKVRLVNLVRKPEYVALADEDREQVAQTMVHYGLTIVPVTTREGVFLGAVPSDTLVEVIEQETSEDIYRMSAMAPIKHAYLETPFWRLVYQRGSILLLLLLLQTGSSFIAEHYKALLAGIFIHMTMLISAGGNASSQSSALMIQGMATGELHEANILKFLRREFSMALVLSVVLSIFQFVRMLVIYGNFFASLAVSISLAFIVVVAIMFGSSMPWILKKFNVDPAHSAGPLLATLMDIVGVLIFCLISQLILGATVAPCAV